MLGLMYVVLTTFAFYYLVCRGLLGWLPAVGAVVLTAVVASVSVMLFSVVDVGTAVLILWFLTLVRPQTLKLLLPAWTPAVLGGAAALQLLVKFDAGGAALVAAFVVSVARPPRLRNVGLLASSFLVSLIVLWLAAQQSLANITEWIRESFQIAVGYSSVMAAPAGFGGGRYWFFWLVVVGLLGFGIWRLVQIYGARSVPTVALLAVAVAVFTKEGFTRVDSVHPYTAYVCLGALIATIPWETRWRTVGVVGIAVASSACVVTSGGVGSFHLVGAERRGLEEAGRIVRSSVEPPYRSEQLRAARRSLDAFYKLSSPLVSTLRHDDVDADPQMIAAVWAYGLRWRPVPVSQTYAAYTSSLDRLNAESLLRSDGPDAVIRQQLPYIAIWHFPAWESPNYMVTLTCNYEMTAETKYWQVLKRTSNACGQPHQIGQQVLDSGKSARVPIAQNPNDIVVATFDYPTSAAERLSTILLKPFRLPTVLTDRTTSAFVAGTASQLHLLRVPNAIGTRHITNAGLDIRSLSFPNAEGAVTVRFYELATS